MKKIRDKINPAPATSGIGQNTYIGKTFNLPKQSVIVEDIIAEGGFGIVFLVRHANTKSALKRTLVNNEIDLSVATREIQFMTQLNHPNLLACTDYSVTPQGGGITEVLILMPYLRGSLLSILNGRRKNKTNLNEQEVLDVLVDVIAGISRLHQCATPVIHRDIKIENVLEQDGKYVLCDFGSATAKIWDPVKDGATATKEDLEKYTTPAYRAPEMVDLYSGRGVIACKSDIWALGVFIYMTCFHTTPFGDSILAIQSANLTFPSDSTYSPSLHSLIRYLLTSDQELRPDIYQVAHLVHELHGTENPIKNLNGVEQPPTFQYLINSMSQIQPTKNNEDKPKSTSVTPAPPTPLETSVTPRQRPKGSIVIPTPNPCGPTLLPPPKSPKPEHVDIGHRRNASDSSTIDKNSVAPSKNNCATSDQTISSWNPFDRDFKPPCTTDSTNMEIIEQPISTHEIVDEDDPFEKAPFDFLKYCSTMAASNGCLEDQGSVDLFGLAPFSNPFLEFTHHHLQSNHHQINTNHHPPGEVKKVGVTNLCFEDER